MPHLRSVSLRHGRRRPPQRFPFSVPIIRELPVLPLSPTVTFLVGENGSGKSTLLEGIAAAANLPAVGSESVELDATLEAQRTLGQRAVKLVWNQRVRRGFFLRAEDFFGFTKALSKLRAELLERARRASTSRWRIGRRTRAGSPRVRSRRRSPTWSGATA